MPSEKQQRHVSKEWSGDFVQIELAQFSFTKCNGVKEIKSAPLAYVHDFQDHLTTELNNLDRYI